MQERKVYVYCMYIYVRVFCPVVLGKHVHLNILLLIIII